MKNKSSNDYKIFLCKGERVTILQSFTHTYVVQMYLTKRTYNVHKSLVTSYYPNRKKKTSANSKKKPQQIQTKFNF